MGARDQDLVWYIINLATAEMQVICGFMIIYDSYMIIKIRLLLITADIYDTALFVSTCLRLLWLMASAILVVLLSHLHIRDFQFWVATCGLNPVPKGPSCLCLDRQQCLLTVVFLNH